MDLSFVDQNSNRRRTRTLPSWMLASTSTSGAESSNSQRNSRNDSSKIAKISSPVAVKIEFTECDDDIASVYPFTDPEPIDVKPKVQDLPSSSTSETVDIKPKIEDLSLELADVKPKKEDLSLESADVKPKIEEIPIETVFVPEGDDTEFMQEDSATTVGTVDSTNADDRIISENDAVVSETEPFKEPKPESSTQDSRNISSASVSPSSSAAPTSTNIPLLSIRRMCVYRHKCYRTNPQHKLEFSHPGDNDYDGKAEADSTSGASGSKPRCWYGSNCYRRSEEHKQKFSHSPPNSRKRNVTRARRENTNTGDDSDAFDDSFIDDDSLDDFGGSEDEETEFSDFDSSSSSDEDSHRGSGRSKKKKFNIL